MASEDHQLDFQTVLASSVHDMKNSLTMLLGSIAGITQQCMPSTCPVHGELIRIQHESRRVNQDLIHLLALYKIDSDQYLTNISEYAMNYFLEDIINENQEVLSGYGINMELDCPDDISAFFDLDLVSGVINTVINNSYRYTKDTIRLSCTTDDAYTIISVEDNGSGYPDNMLSENTTAMDSVNYGTGSTGLGLYFASRVARLHKNKNTHGFTTTTNSGINGGGKFSIYLP